MKAPTTLDEACKLVLRNQEAWRCKMLLVKQGLTDMLNPIVDGGLVFAITHQAELVKGVPPACVLVAAFRPSAGALVSFQAYAMPEAAPSNVIEQTFSLLMIDLARAADILAEEAHLFRIESVDFSRN